MLKQLKYFQSVVRLNSFSEAAAENFISQSAISQQVQALERELGFRLLERKKRTFTLTPAGEYFYQKSLILTADYERMCSEAAKIAKGSQTCLRIGYLRCYTGSEFHRALELFSEKHPDVDVSVAYGNHEELYAMLRSETVDLVLNDQRRAFSDEYVNLLLTTCESYVELSARSPLSQLSQISSSELKNTPCILVASAAQRETEQEYYQNVVGLQSEFLYAENMEEARLMVIGHKGFLPIEGRPVLATMGPRWCGFLWCAAETRSCEITAHSGKRLLRLLCRGVRPAAESTVYSVNYHFTKSTVPVLWGRCFSYQFYLFKRPKTEIDYRSPTGYNMDQGGIKMKKLLIVYYSWSNGNTERIAKALQRVAGGDLLQIDTARPYSGSYSGAWAMSVSALL